MHLKLTFPVITDLAQAAEWARNVLTSINELDLATQLTVDLTAVVESDDPALNVALQTTFIPFFLKYRTLENFVTVFNISNVPTNLKRLFDTLRSSNSVAIWTMLAAGIQTDKLFTLPGFGTGQTWEITPEVLDDILFDVERALPQSVLTWAQRAGQVSQHGLDELMFLLCKLKHEIYVAKLQQSAAEAAKAKAAGEFTITIPANCEDPVEFFKSAYDGFLKQRDAAAQAAEPLPL